MNSYQVTEEERKDKKAKKKKKKNPVKNVNYFYKQHQLEI